MEAIGILWTLIIGMAIGAIAGCILKGRSSGIIVNMIFGVLGSVLGGWVYTLIGFQSTSMAGILLMSVIGAIVMLGILSLIPKRTE